VFYLDRKYILFAIGLLAQEDPDRALRIAKKNLLRLPEKFADSKEKGSYNVASAI
jgi:hypothetical protein